MNSVHPSSLKAPTYAVELIAFAPSFSFFVVICRPSSTWCSIHSNAAGVCWNFLKRIVLQLCSVLSDDFITWSHQPTNQFWSGTTISVTKGCICDQRKGHSGRPSVSEEVVDRVRQTFLRSPKKSTRRCSRELQVPQSTVSKILHKNWGLSLTSCNWSSSCSSKIMKHAFNFAAPSRS